MWICTDIPDPHTLACPRIASQIAAMPSQLASQVSNRRKQTRPCDKSPSHRGQIAKSQIELRQKLASQHILLQLSSIRFAENLQAARNYNKTQSVFEKKCLGKARLLLSDKNLRTLCNAAPCDAGVCFLPQAQNHIAFVSPKRIIKIENIAPRTQHDTPACCHGSFRGKLADLEHSPPLHRSHIAATSLPHRWITNYRQLG